MLERIRVGLIRLFLTNTDLLLLWLVLLVAQHWVPVTHEVGRDDLGPWLMIALSGVALLRAERFGNGPHPMLTPRISDFDFWVQRAAYAASPWVLLFIYDGLRMRSTDILGRAVLLGLGAMVAMAAGGVHGQTAWNPDRRPPALPFLIGGAGIMGTVGAAGYLAGTSPSGVYRGITLSILVGLAFLTVGLLAGRVQNHRQRKAAGRKDGKPYRIAMFGAVLAAAGPFTSLAVVFYVLPNLAFDQAYVVSLLVVVWAGIVWPPQSPIMVACVLHEVLPTGGADPIPADQANAFDVPPEGALRFNPMQTRRTLVMHPWLVPVKSSRIAELDDPIRPLWPAAPPRLNNHLFGEASFEPDPVTKLDQWDVITVRMRSQEDTATMGGDAKSRRIVILRPFPAPGTSARPRLATYRWDQAVPDQAIQILDATTQTATLRSGDVILLSSEGVATAFEVEVGAPVYRAVDATAFRPPQLEDYVGA
jgi:hypothetical protein